MWPNQAATFEPLETDNASGRGVGAAKPTRGPILAALLVVTVLAVGAVAGSASLLRPPAKFAQGVIAKAEPSPDVPAASAAPPASTSSNAAVIVAPIPSAAPEPILAVTATAKATTAAVKAQGPESKPRPAATEHAAPARAAAAPTANCSPPYVVDASGRHVPKPECL